MKHRVALVFLALLALSAGGVSRAGRGSGLRIVLAGNRDGTMRAYSVLPDGSRLTPLLAPAAR